MEPNSHKNGAKQPNKHASRELLKQVEECVRNIHTNPRRTSQGKQYLVSTDQHSNQKQVVGPIPWVQQAYHCNQT